MFLLCEESLKTQDECSLMKGACQLPCRRVFARLARCVLALPGVPWCCCEAGHSPSVDTKPCRAAPSAHLGSPEPRPGWCCDSEPGHAGPLGCCGWWRSQPPGSLPELPLALLVGWRLMDWFPLYPAANITRIARCLGFLFSRTGKSHCHFQTVLTAFLYSLWYKPTAERLVCSTVRRFTISFWFDLLIY